LLFCSWPNWMLNALGNFNLYVGWPSTAIRNDATTIARTERVQWIAIFSYEASIVGSETSRGALGVPGKNRKSPKKETQTGILGFSQSVAAGCPAMELRAPSRMCGAPRPYVYAAHGRASRDVGCEESEESAAAEPTNARSSARGGRGHFGQDFTPNGMCECANAAGRVGALVVDELLEGLGKRPRRVGRHPGSCSWGGDDGAFVSTRRGPRARAPRLVVASPHGACALPTEAASHRCKAGCGMRRRPLTRPAAWEAGASVGGVRGPAPPRSNTSTIPAALCRFISTLFYPFRVNLRTTMTVTCSRHTNRAQSATGREEQWQGSVSQAKDWAAGGAQTGGA
jgi:hypothetical protein